MDAQALGVIQNMASTTLDFAGDVVTNLWGIFLSLAVLAFAGAFILRKTRVSR